MSGILILGAGGHAKVIADILMSQGIAVRGYVDDNPAAWGTTPLGLPVLGPIDSYLDHQPDGLVMGIGSNVARRTIVERLGQPAGDLWCNAIHPDSTLAASIQLGRGVVIMARAVVNPDTTMGDHVIINTGAVVEHDYQIGHFAHVAPGCLLTGGTTVGDGAFLGAGTIVIPYHTIGDWAITGAGSVVVRDVPPHITVKGVPAR
jgi:sugar O-acyltransferase (sialic acid O-acetyltransferase NeuD family)